MSKTKVLAMLNNKGGVGKTTCVCNLAYALANKGKDVLLIDFDSQASATNYLNVGLGSDKYYYSIYEMLVRELRDVITKEEDEILSEINPKTKEGFSTLCKLCICKPTYNLRKKNETTKKMEDLNIPFGFDLLPSKLNLSDFELELTLSIIQDPKGYAYRLYNLVQKIIAWHEYDYIFIDCNPSLGIMALNAITAAINGVLIPTNLDLMSTRGINNLIDKVVDIQETLYNSTNGEIKHMGVVGIILNLYSDRRNIDKNIEEDLNRFYPFKIFKTQIPESINAKKAVSAGALYSQMYKKAEDAFDKLAEDIEIQINQMEKDGVKIGQRIEVQTKGESV